MIIKTGMNESKIAELALEIFTSFTRFGGNSDMTYETCVEMAVYHLYPHANN